MQTIRVNNYENKKGLNLKKNFDEYWKTLKKAGLQYLILIIFFQMINLLLIILLFPYAWGIAVHFVILGIILSVLLFKWLRKAKVIQFVTLFIVPVVLLTLIISLLLIGLSPGRTFPETWDFSDNNAARMTSINKFRVSQIELQFPVTFKTKYSELSNIVDQWIDDNNFSSNNQTIIDPNSEGNIHIGMTHQFSKFQFYSLFGMVNDMHIRIIE
mmetsp:Transcript_2580/g.3031  ORF Transcript_2580/g.3031 Transcript_2580/m.3031 type:complete len:214 (+) Transcript_2580:31-672(+)